MLVCTVPNVTVTPLPSSCTSFPGYDNGTGIATPLKVVADSTGKGIDGGSFVPKYATAVGGGYGDLYVLSLCKTSGMDLVSLSVI